MIDRQQASDALSDIDDIVRRVRQSRIYNLASLIMILWGVLVFAGNVMTYLWPRYGGTIWIAIDVAGVLGSVRHQHVELPQDRRPHFRRTDAAGVPVVFRLRAFRSASGSVTSTPRQLATFWSLYAMMAYIIAGLWFGNAFVALGLAISALTLIGYFFVGDWFDLWMAVVNGGGLVLVGLWMRRS